MVNTHMSMLKCLLDFHLLVVVLVVLWYKSKGLIITKWKNYKTVL